jgi:hypothetical protein
LSDCPFTGVALDLERGQGPLPDKEIILLE